MQYLIVFFEGIITFVSPCLLPMLPIYLSFFMGGEAGGEAEDGPARGHARRRTHGLKNALAFVLGFTLVFVALGSFAGSLGQLLAAYATWVNLVAGAVVVLLGLHYVGLLKIGFLNRSYRAEMKRTRLGFWPSLLFGIVFSIGWTPCVGAFLGSALMLAGQQGSLWQGMLMLLLYSLGLGLPFVLSALLLDRLKTGFAFIKRHYRVVNLISGSFLIIIGLLMMTGYLGKWLSLLS